MQDLSYIIKSVCSDYDYLTVTMVFICIHLFGSSIDLYILFILKTFLLLDFRCNKDHECSYMYVQAAMVGRVMLCGVGSMFLVDFSLVQLFVSNNFSVLTLAIQMYLGKQCASRTIRLSRIW